MLFLLIVDIIPHIVLKLKTICVPGQLISLEITRIVLYNKNIPTKSGI